MHSNDSTEVSICIREKGSPRVSSLLDTIVFVKNLTRLLIKNHGDFLVNYADFLKKLFCIKNIVLYYIWNSCS